MSDTITTPETTVSQDRNTQPFSLKRLRNAFKQPSFILGLMLFILLVLLVLMPLLRLVTTTLTGEGLEAWNDVLNSRLSENLFWRPLANTLAIGATVAIGTLMIGGFLAWLVMMTDIPGRGLIGALAAIPFALPSFAIALAWETIFRNDRVGGQIGVLQDLGLSIPDWLAWGFIPVVLTLVAHYYSLAFVLISASLASVNTELLEAAEMTGAKRRRVLTDITLPIVAPAIVSSALLAFAEGVSNFAAPALLGLPVRFHTISTRLYGSISTGQVERGYVLAILLILVAAVLLWSSTRFVSGRRSFATITGKGGRRKRQQLGNLRWPLFAVALSVCVATTILPTLALLGSSFARSTGSFSSGFTSHFWIGASDPSLHRDNRAYFATNKSLRHPPTP